MLYNCIKVVKLKPNQPNYVAICLPLPKLRNCKPSKNHVASIFLKDLQDLALSLGHTLQVLYYVYKMKFFLQEIKNLVMTLQKITT